MSWEALVLVLIIHAVALISPGPDFAIVTRLSIVSGRRTGIWAATGVVTAIGLYILICALGLSVVVAALPWISKVLSVIGALYLAWLGLQCLRSQGKLPETSPRHTGSKAFITGFLTNLLNPKAMLYFGSVLSQVLKPELSATDTTILWGLLVCESFLWFGLVAVLFSSPPVLEWLRRRMIWFDRLIGMVLIGLAAKLAMSDSK